MKTNFNLLINFIRFSSSIGFGVLYSSLAIFMTNHLHFSTKQSIMITGIFISLHYSLATLNGVIVGRWISYIDALNMGILLQIIGFIYLYQNYSHFFLGCAIFLVGSISGALSINMLITQEFQNDSNAREKYFIYNYVAMNVGNITGFTIAGYSQIHAQLGVVQYLVGILMSISLIIGITKKRSLKDHNTPYVSLNFFNRRIANIKFLTVLFTLILITQTLLIHSSVTSNYLLIVLLGVTIFLLISNLNNNAANGAALIVFATFYLLFWSLYFLIPTGLSIFIAKCTNNQVFNFYIAPAWVVNVNSFVVIVGGLLLPLILKRFNQTNKLAPIIKFIIGGIFVGLTFFTIILGILVTQFKFVPIMWIIVAYIFLSIAELLIAPIGLALVARYVKPKNQSILSGMWWSLLGVGGLISSKISNYINFKATSIIELNHSFLHFFGILLCIIMLGTLILYMISKTKPFAEN